MVYFKKIHLGFKFKRKYVRKPLAPQPLLVPEAPAYNPASYLPTHVSREPARQGVDVVNLVRRDRRDRRGITQKPAHRVQNPAYEHYLATGKCNPKGLDAFIPYASTNRKSVPILLLSILNKQVRAVVDTGATRTLMSSVQARAILGPDFKKYLRPTQLLTTQADGSPLTLLGEVTLQLIIGERPYVSPVIVFENEDPTFLLGWDFLQTHLLVPFPHGLGTMPREYIPDGLEKEYNLVLAEDWTLQARSVGQLPANIADENNTEIPALERFKLLGKSVLVDPLPNCNLALKVGNMTQPITNDFVTVPYERRNHTEDLFLKKGTPIAYITNWEDGEDLVQSFLAPSSIHTVRDDEEPTSTSANNGSAEPGQGNEVPMLEREQLLQLFYHDFISRNLKDHVKTMTVDELNQNEPYNCALTDLIRGTVRGQDAKILASLLTGCNFCSKTKLLKCGIHTAEYKKSLGLQDNKEMMYNCLLCDHLCCTWTIFSKHAQDAHAVDVGKRSSDPEPELDYNEGLGWANMAIDKFIVQGNDDHMLVTPEGMSVGSRGLMPEVELGKLDLNNWQQVQECEYLTNPSREDGQVLDRDVISRGTSTCSQTTNKTVTDIKDLLGSSLSSRPPTFSEPSQRAEVNLEFSTEHENVKLDDINFYYHGEDREKVKKQVVDVMSEVPNLWSKSNYDMGTFKYEVKVPLQKKLPHIQHPHRPTHPTKVPVATELINKLQEGLVMQLGMSTWSSPAVWVVKAPPEAPGGAGKKLETGVRNLRLAVDYRQANKFVRSVSCPSPSAKQMINLLAGKKYATIIDLAHGFWTIKVDELARKFFSVQALGQVYNFNRLAMGALSSPAIFIACVLYTLRGLESFCIAYADNVTVVSDTIEDHIRHLRLVLKRLEYYGWKVKHSKIHFCLHDVPLKFLGFYFNLAEQSMYPDPEKIATILDMKRPNSVKTVRRLLGSLNFYSEFIPNMQHLVRPISDLLKGRKESEEILWNQEAEEAWVKLKLAITAELKLQLPDYKNNKFHLVTDASPQTAAMVLMQLVDGKWKIVGNHSKKLTETESRYAQSELELLAIIEGLKHFQDTLTTAEVFIHTDCRALLYLKLFENASSKLARYLTFLNSFNHKIIFESSTTPLIKYVDFLTRTTDQFLDKPVYSKQRKLDFENLPPMTLNDLNGVTELAPNQYMPLLQQFLDQHASKLTPVADKEVKEMCKDFPEVSKNKESAPEPLKAGISADLMADDQMSHVSLRSQCAGLDHEVLPKADPIPCMHTNELHTDIFQPCYMTEMEDDQKAVPSEGLINLLQFECPDMDVASIIKAQQMHPRFEQLRKECSKRADLRSGRFYLIEDVLYKSMNIDNKQYLVLVLPTHTLYDTIAHIHRSPVVGHSGTRRLYEFARRRFFAPGLRRIVESTVQACSLCMKYKPNTSKRRVVASPIKANAPGEIWHLDLCVIAKNTLPGDKNQPLQFVTCVDSVTKYCVAWVAKLDYTHTELLQDFFSRVVAPFGKPIGIVTDSEFHDKLTHDFCNALRIKKLRISPRSSKSNMAERMHRHLLTAIRIYRENHNMKAVDWPNLLYWGLLAWNHSETAEGKVPAKQFTGRSQKSPWSCFQEVPFSVENFTPGIASLISTQHVVANVLNRVREYEEEICEKQSQFNTKAHEFPPGTQVYIRAPLLNEKYKKLRPRWRGVYTVVEEFQTAVLVVPIRSEIIAELDQVPRDVPRKVTPVPKTFRVDKSELKKVRALTFFSRPLARDFSREFFKPYESPAEFWMDNDAFDDVIEDEINSLPETFAQKSQDQVSEERSASSSSDMHSESMPLQTAPPHVRVTKYGRVIRPPNFLGV